MRGRRRSQIDRLVGSEDLCVVGRRAASARARRERIGERLERGALRCPDGEADRGAAPGESAGEAVATGRGGCGDDDQRRFLGECAPRERAGVAAGLLAEALVLLGSAVDLEQEADRLLAGQLEASVAVRGCLAAEGDAFQALVREKLTGGIDPTDPLWRLTPFVDFPGEYGPTEYRFEWEREWRVPGELTFGPDDVAFLFIPESFHAAARTFFEGHLADHSGPAYLCPYVDPTWDMPRVQTAFAAVATPIAGMTSTTADPYGTCDYCGGPTHGGQCLLCGGLSLS